MGKKHNRFMSQGEFEALTALTTPGGCRVTCHFNGPNKYGGAGWYCASLQKLQWPFTIIARATGNTEKDALHQLIDAWMKL